MSVCVRTGVQEGLPGTRTVAFDIVFPASGPEPGTQWCRQTVELGGKKKKDQGQNHCSLCWIHSLLERPQWRVIISNHKMAKVPLTRCRTDSKEKRVAIKCPHHPRKD